MWGCHSWRSKGCGELIACRGYGGGIFKALADGPCGGEAGGGGSPDGGEDIALAQIGCAGGGIDGDAESNAGGGWDGAGAGFVAVVVDNARAHIGDGGGEASGVVGVGEGFTAGGVFLEDGDVAEVWLDEYGAAGGRHAAQAVFQLLDFGDVGLKHFQPESCGDAGGADAEIVAFGAAEVDRACGVRSPHAACSERGAAGCNACDSQRATGGVHAA